MNEIVAPDRPGLSQEAARSILSLGFTESALKRVRELLAANNLGTIASEERAELDKYLRVGQFLDPIDAAHGSAALDMHLDEGNRLGSDRRGDPLGPRGSG